MDDDGPTTQVSRASQLALAAIAVSYASYVLLDVRHLPVSGQAAIWIAAGLVIVCSLITARVDVFDLLRRRKRTSGDAAETPENLLAQGLIPIVGISVMSVAMVEAIGAVGLVIPLSLYAVGAYWLAYHSCCGRTPAWWTFLVVGAVTGASTIALGLYLMTWVRLWA